MALTVLKGGLDGQPKEKEEQKPFVFVSAWITDTRLMGVNAMYINWKDRMDNDVHQFFYFDAVDTGFERFQEITGNDERRSMKQRFPLPADSAEEKSGSPRMRLCF